MSKKRRAGSPAGVEDLWEATQELSGEKRDELVARLLSVATKEELAARWWPKPTREKLRLDIPADIFVQDPSVAQFNPKLGIQEIALPWESGLLKGPTGARIAVVDYDGDVDGVTEPACWDADKWRFVGPDGQRIDRRCKESFQFHQVNVWAIVTRVLDFFEDPEALGRCIPWAFSGNRLIVVPHAGYGKNAFYDRRSKTLQFYYFGTEQKPVFTCLSHDIIAHETGHAILDGVRPYYNEISSFQTSAFHEFVADLSAILVAMRNNDIRHVLAEATKGDLTKDTLVAHVAEEFGKHVVDREFLRTARNPLKMSKVTREQSPHYNSQVLTGAMFDILRRLAGNYMEKRKKTAKQALWYAIGRMTRVALQPLDYCPPVDIQFEDYANAVLRRDRLSDPRDPQGYRDIMREVFRERQIAHSEDEDEPDYSDFYCYDIEQICSSRAAAYRFLHGKRKLLFIPEQQDLTVENPYSASKVRRLHRRLPQEFVLQYVWREGVELKGSVFGQLEGRTVPLLCGGTLVYDDEGNLLYWSRKPGTEFRIRDKKRGDRRKEEEELAKGKKRRTELLEYVATLVEKGRVGLTEGGRRAGLESWSPVIGREVDGDLRLMVTPRLHHSDES